MVSDLKLLAGSAAAIAALLCPEYASIPSSSRRLLMRNKMENGEQTDYSKDNWMELGGKDSGLRIVEQESFPTRTMDMEDIAKNIRDAVARSKEKKAQSNENESSANFVYNAEPEPVKAPPTEHYKTKLLGLGCLGGSAAMFLLDVDYSSLEMTIILSLLLVTGITLSTMNRKSVISERILLWFLGAVVLIAPSFMKEFAPMIAESTIGDTTTPAHIDPNWQTAIHGAELLVIVAASFIVLYASYKLMGSKFCVKNDMGVYSKSMTAAGFGAFAGVLAFGVPSFTSVIGQKVSEEIIGYTNFGAIALICLSMSAFMIAWLNSAGEGAKASGPLKAAATLVILSGVAVTACSGVTTFMGADVLSSAVTIYAAIGFGAIIVLMSVIYSIKNCGDRGNGDGMRMARI